MSRFAKVAAQTMVALDEDPEEQEQPAWRRALPWVAGAAGLGALGYAAWKNNAPAPQGPGVTGTVFGPIRGMTEGVGGPIGAGVLAAGAGAAGHGANMIASGRLNVAQGGQVHKLLHDAQIQEADVARNDVGLRKMFGVESASNQSTLNKGLAELNELDRATPGAPPNLPRSSLVERLQTHAKASKLSVKDLVSELRGSGASTPGLAHALGDARPHEVANRIEELNSHHGNNALSPFQKLGRTARFGGSLGLASTVVSGVGSVLGSPDWTNRPSWLGGAGK